MARSDMFMSYMYCFIVINVTPIYCALGSGAVGVTAVSSLVEPWTVIVTTCGATVSRGVVIKTAPLCLVYMPWTNKHTARQLCGIALAVRWFCCV